VEEAQGAAGGVGRRHGPHGAVVEEVGVSLLNGLEETGAASRVIRAAWDRNRAGVGDAQIRADGAE
jgi:hypothetical protein